MAIVGGGVDPADLKDNPQNYKGRTITLRRVYLPYGNTTLRQWRDRMDTLLTKDTYIVRFQGLTPDITVDVQVPFKMDVPAVTGHDPLWIKFRCNEGSLIDGNELIDMGRE